MGQQQLIPHTQIALFEPVELPAPVVAVERSFDEKVAIAGKDQPKPPCSARMAAGAVAA